MMDAYYIIGTGADGNTHYRQLNPTGRWKLESGPYVENELFVEHQGWIFKQWISEINIEFKTATKTFIMEASQ